MSGEECQQLLMIRSLADKGASMDCVNFEKETPFDLTFYHLPHCRHKVLMALFAMGSQQRQFSYKLVQCIKNIEDFISEFSVTTENGQAGLRFSAPAGEYYPSTGSFLDVFFRDAVKGAIPSKFLLALLAQIGANRTEQKRYYLWDDSTHVGCCVGAS